MKPFNIFTTVVLCFASGSALLAQRPTNGERYRPEIASVSGTVVEADGTSPIPFASVALLALRDSTIVAGQLANEDGTFYLTEIPIGKYTLNIQFMGYEGFTSKPMMLTPRTSVAYNAGNIELNKKVNDLNEAVVATEASTLEMLIDRRVFRVGNDLSAAGGNAAEILVNVPSVAVDIDGNVSLRGSAQVQILIDGRPSGLAGAAQNAFLEQIPASSIDRVEIITNPSAKYDPDGMAGILNIILKKNKLQGFHGQLQGTVGTGDNHNGSVSLNYKNDKFSVFSSASWNQRDLFREGESSRTLTLDSVSTLNQTRDGDQLRTSINGRLGMEWYPSKSEVLSVNLNVNQSDNKRSNGLTNDESWDTGVEFESLRSSMELDASNGFDADLGYRKEYDQNPSHFLRFRARHSRSESSSDEYIHEESALEITGIPSASVRDTNLQENRSMRTVLQLDYEKPLGNEGKFECGLKSNLSRKDDKFDYIFSDSSVWSQGIYIPINPIARSFAFEYREDVHAAYATYGRKWGTWGTQAGLRLEQVFTGARWENDQTFENNYFSAYPSVNVSRQSNDEVSWIASYSRRVNRPRGRSVTPFLDDSDSRNLRIGNPELRPEYTNSYEIGHQWSRKRKSLTTSFFVKETNDLIQRYSNIDSAGIKTSSWWNQGSRRDEGIEVILMVPLPGSGQFRFTGSFYHLSNKVGDVEFASDAQGWSYNLNFFANQSWGADKQWKWQLNGMYRGPSVTPQGQFNGFAYMDANLQRKLLDGNLTIAIKLSDVFNTREWSYTSDFGNLYQENRFKRESQNIFLTATWKLGKLEQRGSRGGYPREGSFGGESGGMDF
jgi:outer membrane receptor protein involved in Fe transport